MAESISRLAVLVRQLQGWVGGRRLRGSVTSGGAVGAGSGFSASTGGTGLYTVTFSTAFESTPFVFVQPVTSGGVRAAAVSSSAADSFSVEIRNDAGALANSAFYFEATG